MKLNQLLIQLIRLLFVVHVLRAAADALLLGFCPLDGVSQIVRLCCVFVRRLDETLVFGRDGLEESLHFLVIRVGTSKIVNLESQSKSRFGHRRFLPQFDYKRKFCKCPAVL